VILVLLNSRTETTFHVRFYLLENQTGFVFCVHPKQIACVSSLRLSTVKRDSSFLY